jgi:hypothetical protein
MSGYGNDNYDQQSSGGFGNQAYGVNDTQGGGYGGPGGQGSNYSDNQSGQGGQYGHEGRYEEGDGKFDFPLPYKGNNEEITKSSRPARAI